MIILSGHHFLELKLRFIKIFLKNTRDDFLLTAYYHRKIRMLDSTHLKPGGDENIINIVTLHSGKLNGQQPKRC